MRSDGRREHAPSGNEVRRPTSPPCHRWRGSWGVDLGRALAAVAVVVIHAWLPATRRCRPRRRRCASWPASRCRSSWPPRRSSPSEVHQRHPVGLVHHPRRVSCACSCRMRRGRPSTSGSRRCRRPWPTTPTASTRCSATRAASCFLGGASVQLYFLPMLAVGMLLLPVVDAVARRLPLQDRRHRLRRAVRCCRTGTWAGTGNAYDIATATAFRDLVDPNRTRAVDAVVRLLLVAVAWAARFLPVPRRSPWSCGCTGWTGSAPAGCSPAPPLFVAWSCSTVRSSPTSCASWRSSFALLLVCFAVPSPEGPGRSSPRRRAASPATVRHLPRAHRRAAGRAGRGRQGRRRLHCDTMSLAMVVATAVPTFLLAWLGAARHRPHRAAAQGPGRRLSEHRRPPSAPASARRAAHDEVGHQRGPTGLVRRAEPGADVAVEVLVEEHVVAPARDRRTAARCRGTAAARRALGGTARSTARPARRPTPSRSTARPEPVGQLHRHLGAEVRAVAAQRFDHAGS